MTAAAAGSAERQDVGVDGPSFLGSCTPGREAVSWRVPLIPQGGQPATHNGSHERGRGAQRRGSGGRTPGHGLAPQDVGARHIAHLRDSWSSWLRTELSPTAEAPSGSWLSWSRTSRPFSSAICTMRLSTCSCGVVSVVAELMESSITWEWSVSGRLGPDPGAYRPLLRPPCLDHLSALLCPPTHATPCSRFLDRVPGLLRPLGAKLLPVKLVRART